MKYFIILLSLSLTFSLHAQNYQLFNKSSAKVFTTYIAPQHAYSISFDSVIYENGDSVYYNFYKLPLKTNFVSENCEFWGTNECYKQNFPVWMGEKVIEDNSSYLFFNLWDDTLSFDFKPDDDTTIFFKDDTQQFAMVYTGKDTLSVLNQSDSVRYFKVLHTLVNGDVSDSELNNFEITVGKSFGLIRFFQIDSFPQVQKPLYLIGNTNPQGGLTALSNEVLHQYNIGDVLEYKYYSSVFPGPPEQTFTLFSFYTVLDKTETTDSLKYLVKRERFYQDSLLLLTDTIAWDYKKDAFVAQVPFERFDGNYNKLYLANYGDRKLWTYQTEAENSLIYCEADNVWGPYDTFGPPDKDSKTFVEGIGSFNSTHVVDKMDGYYTFKENQLIYFNLSGAEWGDKVYLDIKEQNHNTIAVNVFPNPASNQITVESDGAMRTIFLFQLTGKSVIEMNIGSTIQSIDLSGIKSGVYLMNILMENGSVFTKKIIVSK